MMRRASGRPIKRLFVILSGLSGSGKTKLAQALGYWLGRGEDGMRAAVIPVGPDWTSVDNTLGYPNALDPSQYSTTEVLQRVLSARKHPEVPHILVLDEMNLSHVERYFADILWRARAVGAPNSMGPQLRHR